MKNRKKIRIIICGVVLLALIVNFLLGNIFLWHGIYMNNLKLKWEENVEIKKLVLAAIKDRCSELYDINKTEIYDANASELEIIQYDEEAKVKKTSWVCLFDPFFMDNVTKNENEYIIKVKMIYPESYYYEIHIQKDTRNNYIITSFVLDV